jgi:hypothetical protein
MMRPRAVASIIAVASIGAVGAAGAIGHAAADPIRLRGDALATTSSPAGLLTLEAGAVMGPGLSAEAMVWTGSTSELDDVGADVLVIALRARTAGGRASVRLGRFVESLGALRPMHVDGAAGRVRLPYRFDVEAYGGIPVVPRVATARTWDWASGGRLARQIGDSGSIGLAYVQAREGGRLATEELGVDLGAAFGKHDDLGAALAYDVANPGVAEASVTASHRHNALRTELYARYRAASHLLPATSLFSVLGDVPAQRAGTVVTWRAAPRLDLLVDLGLSRIGPDIAPELVARARLSLDDRGASALGGELRRDGIGMDRWTGARAVARIALPRSLSFSTELELVIPDRDRGLGAAWPWGLAALGWDNGTWRAAVAFEASASPEDRRRADVLAQLGRRWGAR